MFKYINILTIILCAHTWAFSAERISIVGLDNIPPYSYVEDGKPTGIYFDIVNTAFSKIPEFEPAYEMLPFKRGMQELKKGAVTAMFPPYYRPTQRPWMAPYSLPMFTEKVVVFCNKNKVVGRSLQHYPNDYQNLLFANNSGFKAPGEAFFKLVEKDLIQVEESNETTHNLLKLLAGRVDCYVNDRIIIQQAMQGFPIERHDLIKEYGEVQTENGYLAFSGKSIENWPTFGKFLSQFNTALTTMKTDGTIDKIVNKYIQAK